MRSSTVDPTDDERPGGASRPAGREQAAQDSPSRFLPGPRPRIIAHRGLALDGAENTMRAFADALQAGADMLETDTRATRDGVALAVHDEDLRRTAGDARRIRDLTAREVSDIEFAHGQPIPALEELLGSFAQVPVNIDVKTMDAAGPAAHAIARTGAAGRVCLTSFDGAVARRAVRAVRRATGITPVRSPSVGTMTAVLLSLAVGAPQRVIDRLLGPYGALQVPRTHRGHPVITPRSVAAAHRAGCEVHAWTIDEVADMRALLGMGVDGIVTNRADLLAQLLGRPRGE